MITKMDDIQKEKDCDLKNKTDGFFIYKYVSNDGRIVYVGKSQSLEQRIKQHNSYAGIDEKFKNYKDATIYVHKCSSKHEMDALEVLLIETYKPELNVSCKTDSHLSFSFCPELTWTNFEEIKNENEQARANKQKAANSRRASKTSKTKYDAYAIHSEKGQNEFITAVLDWHKLFYFFNWISEQSDEDTRATIEFNINDRDIDEWVWAFTEGKTNIENHGVVIGPSLQFKHGVLALVPRCTRQHNHIWIDLYDEVRKLKWIIPSIKADLNHRREEMSKYHIADNYIENCKVDGFYDFYQIVNRGEVFPEYAILEHEASESNALITSDIVGSRNVVHTSPKRDYSNLSTEEQLAMLFSLFRGRTEYY